MASPIDPRLIKRATATRGFLVAVGLVGVLQSLLMIAQASLLAAAIAHVFYTHNLDGVARNAAWVIVVFIARGGLTWLTDVLAHRASAAVKSQLRRDVLAARLADPYHSPTPTGTLIQVATHGLDALDGYFSKFLPQFIMAALVPIIVGVAIGVHDLESVIIIIITVPLIPIFMILVGWTTQERVARRFKVQMRLANYFADLVAGLPTLQVFGRARAQLKGLRKNEDANRAETMSTLRVAFLSAFVLELAATLSVAVVAVTIGFRVVDGHMGLQTALYILILAPEVYLPLRMVGTHFHDSANGTAAANAAFAIIDAAPAAPAASDEPLAASTDVPLLRFRDVTYRYPVPGAPDALARLSFDVRAGEVVALAGPSGAGKSTALGVAAGFLHPSAGQVLVDGRDLAGVSAQAWRHQLAWVGQEPGMITGTVADNIALGHPGAQPDTLRSALDRVGGELIDLDHPVGDAGEGLSSGERRRVAMARALVRIEQGGATLLLLDEPTAGLDQAAEAQAVDAVRALGVAVLVVSHRPAVLDTADRVVHVQRVAQTEEVAA